MDVVNLEAWSCIKQAIVRYILHEADRLGVPPTHHLVITSVINHFNGGLLPNQCFKTIVLQLAQGCPNPNHQGEFVVLSPCHPTLADQLSKIARRLSHDTKISNPDLFLGFHQRQSS